MKELTQEKRAALISQKEKELEKLAKKQLKPIVGRYLIIMLVMVTLNFCIDIFGSNIHSVMKADALNALLHGGDIKDAFSTYENLTVVFGVFVSIALPFYKSLTDRFGRKLFLILNTVITSVGMIIMMFAPTIVIYIIGFVIMTVGYQGDVHQIYILESAPKHMRARFASITKAFSILCGSLIGVFRLLFMEDTVPESWRYVFIIPIIAGLLVAVLSIFFTQETEVFVERRKNTLNIEINELKGLEVTQEEKKEKPMNFFEVIKFIFKNRQMRMLFVAALFFCGAMVFTHTYSLNFDESEGNDALSWVTVIYPVVEGAFSFLGGMISDKIGRKTTVIVNGIIFIVSYILFIVGIDAGFSVLILGLLYGMVSGGYWAGRDTLGTTIPSESCPTQSRATIVGIFTLVTGFANTICNLILANIAKFIPLDLSYIYLIGCIILMICSIFFVIFGVGETKGIDMETVTGTEWNKKEEKA